LKKTDSVRRFTGKRNQHKSMLVTNKTTYENEMPTSAELVETNKSWNVDNLIESMRLSALMFLDCKEIPYDETPDGCYGIVESDFKKEYDHIPGVSAAFSVLFELYCFGLARQNNPEKAYSNLLRAGHYLELLTVAKMEAGYLAGAARVGGSEKTEKKHKRQKHLLKQYKALRAEGKGRQEARRLAALRTDTPLDTAKRWYPLDKIEKACHQFT